MNTKASSPLTGTIIRNNVRIGVQLGRGAMGDVYLAEETHLRRSVAVKFIRENVVGDRRFTRAFLNEARIISQLRHPNIVSLLDFGKTAEGRLFLIMEYIPGKPLSRACAMDGTESPTRIANLVAQVADALEVAHQAGVVHRDIKPDNILVEELAGGRELAKLLDFGLAHQSAGVTDGVSKGKVVGAPAFMSPEQSRAKPVTPRSDVFSLGAVLMLLLSGHRVYEGTTVRKVLRNATMGKVLDPFAVRPTIKDDPVLAALGQVCRKATHAEPEQRYQSAAELAEAVRACTGDGLVAWGALPRAKMPTGDWGVVTGNETPRDEGLGDAAFDATLRGRGTAVQVIAPTHRRVAGVRAVVEEMARRRGMVFIAPPEPVSACQVGEVLAHVVQSLLDATADLNPTHAAAVQQAIEEATLIKRYLDGWHYEATHPILFEASDDGLVMAMRSLLVAVSRVVPLTLMLHVPRTADTGLQTLTHALHTLQGTHAIMVVFATATPLTELSLHIADVDASVSRSDPATRSQTGEAIMVELTQEAYEAATMGDVNTVEEYLIEVNGAVPTEYLGDAAYRIYALVLDSLPRPSFTTTTAKAWLYEGVRAAIRHGDLSHARDWMTLVEGLELSGDDALAELALKTRIAHASRRDLATVELMSELRLELMTTDSRMHTALVAYRDLCHVARRHGFTARLKTQVCPRLVAMVRGIVDDPLSPSPLVHRAVEALLLVVRYIDEAEARQQALTYVERLLERTLPARLEMEARMALVHEEYLVRGNMQDVAVDRAIHRAQLLADRTGALDATYKLHRLAADVALKRGMTADASQQLYQALRISEAIHWPDRLADTLAQLKSLTSMDAVSSVS